MENNLNTGSLSASRGKILLSSSEKCPFDEVLKQAEKQFIKAVDRMYEGKKVDMQEVKLLFGQMELAVKINGSAWMRNLLVAGELELTDYKEKMNRKRVAD